MTWAAWRQHRLEIYLASAVMVALAAFLVPTGLARFDLFRDSGLEACISSGVADCSGLRDEFISSYGSLDAVLTWLNFVPPVVGLLLALPVVIEVERRTYRLAWTQSVTRWRWTAAMLGMALLGVALFSALFTLLMTWWYEPVEIASGDLGLGRNFSFAGLLPFTFTLWAMSLALAAGVTSRRLIVAAVAALVGFLITPVPLLVTVAVTLADGTVDSFWLYQAVEAAVFLPASAMLLALTVWVVNRRMR